MKRHGQQGFAVLEAILILVVVAIIGGTGYFVWHSKNSTEKIQNDANAATRAETQTSNEAEATCGKGFTASVSGKGAFSVCLPMGWGMYRDTTSNLYIMPGSLQPDSNTNKTLGIKNTDGFGSDGPTAFSLNIYNSKDYSVAPSRDDEGTITLASGQIAKKSSFTVTKAEAQKDQNNPAGCDFGCQVEGNTYYKYIVELSGGKQLVLEYNVYHDEYGPDKESGKLVVQNAGDFRDQSKLVDQIVKSIKLLK